MGKTRDDFSAKTIETLAKRVAYRCSNPKCYRLTIAPSQDANDKATTLGVGAHISAASENGPRYDSGLSTQQRVSIDNGIWLCASCSVMIDKEPGTYSIESLKGWKLDTEARIREEYETGKSSIDFVVANKPQIDIEFTWNSSAKWNMGASPNNDSTKPIFVMDVIYFNRLTWTYNLLIVNSSNTKIHDVRLGVNRDDILVEHPPVGTLLNSLESLELKVKFEKQVESTGGVASDMINDIYPKDINGTRITIAYLDEKDNKHEAVVKIENGQPVYEK